MFSKKILFICFVLFACSINFFSQTYISGQVVDIIDGRTLLVETARNARISFRLQYIEVPAAEQPLAEIVKNHLRELAFGKTVDIRSNAISDKIPVGQVLLKNMDLSQQMLRDGAAWFYYGGTENLADYKAMESAAKAEKRGVWGIEGLKPPWEIRRDKEIAEQKRLEEEKKKQEAEEKIKERKIEEEKQEKMRQKILQSANTDPDSISNFGKLNPFLAIEYDSITNEGFVSSPMQSFVVSDDENSVEVLLGFGYEFVGNKLPKNIDDFGIAIGSKFVGGEFLRANEVTVFTDDGKKIVIGKPKSKLTVQNGQILEVLFYKIERGELVKLSAANKSSVKIGKFQRIVEKSTLNIINILLRSAN